MVFLQIDQNSTKKFVGIGLVIFLHFLVIYALATGLAREVVEAIQRPLETRIIAEEIKPPQPPPATPTPPAPQKKVVPPLPFIPPPEVRVAPKVKRDVITVVTLTKPVAIDSTQVTAVPEPVAAMEVLAPAPPPKVPVRVAAVVDPNACQTPAYPRSSQRSGETGTVTLAFLIGVDGLVVDSRVEQSSGFTSLDDAARAGLSRCRFKPGSFDGKPEESWTKMRYVWKLEG